MKTAESEWGLKLIAADGGSMTSEYGRVLYPLGEWIEVSGKGAYVAIDGGLRNALGDYANARLIVCECLQRLGPGGFPWGIWRYRLVRAWKPTVARLRLCGQNVRDDAAAWAARYGRASYLRQVLSVGTSQAARDNALWGPVRYGHLDCLWLILRFGATQVGRDRATYWATAGRRAVPLRLLLETGISEETKDRCVSHAAINPRPGCLRLLLRAGVSDDARRTAVDWAERYGRASCLALLRAAGEEGATK